MEVDDQTKSNDLFRKIQIDFMKLKTFLSEMHAKLGEEKFIQHIRELLELIDFEWQQ